jgi:hypothetical protein
LDRHFLQWIWHSIKKPPTVSPVWTRTMRKTILLLGDSHIVTGVAILTAGFIQSHHMTIYHFQIVLYLAWQANSTHMTTLTILRSYLRRHRPVLKWRITAMTIMFIMLFVCLALTASSVWPARRYRPTLYFDSPVFCAWDSKFTKGVVAWGPDTVFTLCLLGAGYISRLSKLFISTSNFFGQWFRDQPSRWLKLLYDKTERLSTTSNRISWAFGRLSTTLILSVYVALRSLFDLYGSLLSELIWLTFSLLWGVMKIYVWRGKAPFHDYEDTWGFGQLLPLLLLLLPVVSLPEIYSGEYTEAPGINEADFSFSQQAPRLG